MNINLYEKLFTEDLFTAIEYSTIIPPIYIYLISFAYITIVLTMFRYRRRLGSEYLPMQYLIFGLAAFTMGQLHNPMLEDQYSYLTASETLFWDRPLYVWLTFYLRYYGTLLFNLVL